MLKPQKRKRVVDAGDVVPTKKTKTTVRGQKHTRNARPSKANGVQAGSLKMKAKPRRESATQLEELDSDGTEKDGMGEDDLRANEEFDSGGEEDETETPAQKRLRLAKLYLASVREELGGFRVHSQLYLSDIYLVRASGGGL